MTQPTVSVLMSVFDGEKFLREALDSVLAQSLSDLELLVVDDGSRDGTPAILREYADRDERVRVLTNAENIGLTRSLNHGLAAARGAFVARMDADDVSAPNRLEAQVTFLDRNPEIGLLGSAARLIDETGVPIRAQRPPLRDLRIRWRSLFENCFVHSSVVLRREILAKHRLTYDEAFRTAQDSELWSRLLDVTRAANLRAALVSLRLHPQSVSSAHSEEQRRNQDQVALRRVRSECGESDLTPEEVRRLRTFFTGPARNAVPLLPSRAGLSDCYLRLLAAFSARHAGAAGLEALRRREALRILRRLLRLPPDRATPRLLWRTALTALRGNPGVPSCPVA